LRGDFVAPAQTGAYENILGRDPDRAQRWRISPNLTWYPSEFSKIRLQYNYDDRDLIGVDHSVWLQFEFLLGAHAAHKFKGRFSLINTNRIMNHSLIAFAAASLLACSAHAKLNVIVTTADLASIAKEIGGDKNRTHRAGQADRRPALRGRQAELHRETSTTPTP